MELTNRNIPTPRGGHPPRKFPGLDPIQFSYKIAACANELGADAIFVDAGGLIYYGPDRVDHYRRSVIYVDSREVIE